MTDGRRETGSESISEWLTSLARTGANPGGGAAAAVMAGMAAALAEMVAAYRTSAKSAEVVDSAKATAAFAAAMRASAPALADEDTAASSGFAAAYEAGPDEREAAKRAAGLRAAESSVELGRFVERLVPVLRQLAGEAGEFLLSDVGTAAAALAAGARAAGLNILADLRIAGEDAAGRDDLRTAVTELQATATELDGIVAGVWERLAA